MVCSWLSVLNGKKLQGSLPTESCLLNVTLLVQSGWVHWVQGAQNLPGDGTTRVKGKQAKVWNDASRSDHLSAHCHHSFSLFGSRPTDFVVSDLYSSSKPITAASHGSSQCVSTPAAFQSSRTNAASDHKRTSPSGNKRVFLML